MGTVWHDADDATAYRDALGAPIPMLDALASTHDDVQKALNLYARVLEDAQQAARAALNAANAAQAEIAHDALTAALSDHAMVRTSAAAIAPSSAVAGTPPLSSVLLGIHTQAPTGPSAPEILARARASASEIMTNLAVASRQASTVLQQATSTLISWHTGGHRTAATPPLGSMATSTAYRAYQNKFAATHALDFTGPPAAVAARWASMSPELQTRYITDYPAKIGNTDGIPVVARDTASRINLRTLKADLNAKLAAVGPEFLPYDSASLGVWQYRHSLVGSIAGKLSALDAMETMLNSTKPARHYLIGLDPVGNGLGIVSTGNPDTAQDVNVFIPGTGNSLYTMAGNIDRGNKLSFTAMKVSRASGATVTWIGYQAPPTILHATRDSWETTASSLPGFLTGLRATHSGDKSTTTVSGHSYGATALSLAAARTPLDADQLVFIASPGAGVPTAADLKLVGVESADMPKRVFATASSVDPVADAPGFIWANDPTNPDFHDTVFYTPAHPSCYVPVPTVIGTSILVPIYNTDDHNRYWDKDSLPLREQALIMTGQGDKITPVPR